MKELGTPGDLPLLGGRAESGPWLSPVEEFQRIIEAHLGGEAEHIAAYRQIVTDVRDPLIATLMALVIDDEERHHELLRTMAARLRDDLRMTHSPGSLEVYPVGKDETGTLAERTRAYADDERKGAKLLRASARAAGGLYGGAFALLLETMAHDSEKHELVMRFILRRLGHAH